MRQKIAAFIAVFAAFTSAAMFFAGCRGCRADMDPNDRSGAYYYAPHADDTYYYYNISLGDGCSEAGEDYIRVDRATGEVSFFENAGGVNGYIPGEPVEDEPCGSWEREVGNATYLYEIPNAPVILDSMDNGWRGHTRVSRENYGILEALTRKYETGGVSFIHISLLDGGDGSAYGFVNVYDHTTGILFGGGVAGVSGISYGAFIKYSLPTGEIEELLRVDGGCITAFDRDTVMFYRRKKYYSQNIGGEPRFSADDLAYDSGLTGYSRSFMLFNGEHFVLYMHSVGGRRETDYAYVFDSDGNLISSCQAQGL